jgi:hypothetical protein
VLGLLLPAAAQADHPRAGGEPAVAREHMDEHAKIWKAQAKARAEWRAMTRAERRRALRRERRASRRKYARARAAADNPSDVGRWAPPFVTATGYSGYAVHAAMLPTGKVLMWGKQSDVLGTATYAWLWDPAKGYGPGALRDVTPTDASGANIPIVCSGMSFLPDGRLLAVGGTLAEGDESESDEYLGWAGLDKAVVFDPGTETWTELPRPTGSNGRWYPTQVLLADGQTLVVSGFSDDAPGRVLNDGQEIYDPETNSFTLLDSPDQSRATGLYPHLLTMPDGKVLLAGPDKADSAIFDPGNLADPWTDLPQLTSPRTYGNAVLLPEGPTGSTRVAAIGGRMWGQDGPTPAASNEVIDLDDSSPQWSSFPALELPRFNANTILLPDRSLVTVGGDDNMGSPVPERAVELYDPQTGSWRTGPSQVETRAYHSTAVLLPDGRVLSTGDERNPTSDASPTGASPNETAEIYSPPYLFKGPRPVISSAPEAVRWDVPFAVGATGEIDDAVLIAPSAVTHANDMSQRLVPLATVAKNPGGVTLQSPPSAEVAPPGWYMLFVLDDGVPSVAAWVRLDGTAAAPPVVPPEPPEDPVSGSGSGSDRLGEPSSQPDTTSAGDRAGPTLQLRFPKRRWLGQLRRSGGLPVTVTLDERATVDLRLLRRTRRVARAVVEMEPGRRTFELRPRRRTLRWLRNAKAPRLRISAFAEDAAENDSVWTGLLRR